MAKKITKIPEFATRAEEREWWDKHGRDVDPDAFPIETLTFDIQPRERKTRPVCLRMEPSVVARYKKLAAERGIGHLTLMREVLTRWNPSA